MNICEKETPAPPTPEYTHPAWVTGNLYKIIGGSPAYKGDIHLACHNDTMHDIVTGEVWDTGKRFGQGAIRFEDVTDQYCLKKL